MLQACSGMQSKAHLPDILACLNNLDCAHLSRQDMGNTEHLYGTESKHLYEVAVVCGAPLEIVLHINFETLIADATHCCDSIRQGNSLHSFYFHFRGLWRSLHTSGVSRA